MREGREALRGRVASWGCCSGEDLGKPGETGDEEMEPSLLEPRENSEDMRLADLTGADSIFLLSSLRGNGLKGREDTVVVGQVVGGGRSQGGGRQRAKEKVKRPA